LFEQGSWLHKPVKTIMDLFALLDGEDEVHVLDLGCGVGRNTIPIAQRMEGRKGRVVGVDLLPSAVDKLRTYAEQHGVSDKITCCLSDIKDFQIERDRYDYIFAVSSLEHADSEATFDRAIADMTNGTRTNGINCFIISTNVTETHIETNAALEPMYELIFDTSALLRKLQEAYSEWELLKQTVKPYGVVIERDGHRIALRGDVVTFAVRKTVRLPLERREAHEGASRHRTLQ
jgi:cyclopropane fatty-acyl-phospholipid synthase-like methyltransferase